MNYKKYKGYETIVLEDRIWPSRKIEKAQQWCSVDLRDGNQALITPMGLKQKLRAQTGVPQAANTKLTPTVRKKVLFPAILAPVTK